MVDSAEQVKKDDVASPSEADANGKAEEVKQEEKKEHDVDYADDETKGKVSNLQD